VSEIFKNSRGIRQACPLSALLFILSVEIMAQQINESLKPKCFNVLNIKSNSSVLNGLMKSTKIIAPSILYESIISWIWDGLTVEFYQMFWD
jgi:hypothetical protein